MTFSPNLRILIVDDEAFIRSTIRAALRAVGRFDVTEAADGEAALREVRARRPDLILCDVSMEPVTGLDLVRQVRGLDDPVLRDTAVLMVTGQADEATVRNAIHLGVKGYLVKPVSANQVRDRLRAIFPDRQPL